jgi:hypothetical protein
MTTFFRPKNKRNYRTNVACMAGAKVEILPVRGTKGQAEGTVEVLPEFSGGTIWVNPTDLVTVDES